MDNLLAGIRLLLERNQGVTLPADYPAPASLARKIPRSCPPIPACCPPIPKTRKSGQHRLGIPGQLPSEQVDNFDWNRWTTCPGIRMQVDVDAHRKVFDTSPELQAGCARRQRHDEL